MHEPQDNERRANARAAQLDGLYSKIHDEAAVRALTKLPFDADIWRVWFNRYASDHNKPMCKEMRRVIGLQTLKCAVFKYIHRSYSLSACTRLSYPHPQDTSSVELHTREELLSLCQRTVMIDYGNKDCIAPAAPGKLKTNFYVFEKDCLEVTHLFQARKLNPLVLNMASDRRPGGGWRGGAGAQEENLFRRSTYCIVLEDEFNKDRKRKWTYPIPEFGVIYSPDVQVFRGSEAAGYPYLQSPARVAFIACAAYRGPKLVFNKSEPRFAPNFVHGTERKVHAILRCALDNGHDSVVLSAFGCGAFSNPPRHVAEIFHSALTGPFAGCFRAVGFAILDDANAGKAHNPHGNVRPFVETFYDVTEAAVPLASLIVPPPATAVSAKPAAAAGPLAAHTAINEKCAADSSPSAPEAGKPKGPPPPGFSAPPTAPNLHLSPTSSLKDSSPPTDTVPVAAKPSAKALDSSVPLCNFFVKGTCNRGVRCKFRHATE